MRLLCLSLACAWIQRDYLYVPTCRGQIVLPLDATAGAFDHSLRRKKNAVCSYASYSIVYTAAASLGASKNSRAHLALY